VAQGENLKEGQMRISVDVHPGVMLREILEYLENNPDIDHKTFVLTDIEKLDRIKEIIINKKKEAGYEM
jgi:hypothetical protein